MGKSLNYVGKKAGKGEQQKAMKEEKQKKREDFKKFYNSYPVEETSDSWHCSACDEYYSYLCEDKEVHEREWREKSRELVREEIHKEYKKIREVSKSKNKVGYKMARKCFEDEYFGDFVLFLKTN